MHGMMRVVPRSNFDTWPSTAPHSCCSVMRSTIGQSDRVDIRDLSDRDEGAVLANSHLLDGEAKVSATRRFLAQRSHHLLVAEDDPLAVELRGGLLMDHTVRL